ncbi:beta-fructofuranosidase, insoluble isoenzyme 1-like [Hibiscus syriacus]|uniref:beta-fructofuranosidase, insoluble isoenzyme 1-like n=1 Tax=Hibiscus syriacus TaxID=106335 RepID=UPI001924FDAD|nr:beta-fructofuranosidase, insoluble isoenzyme 1-like [Hibiscus syriacus]
MNWINDPNGPMYYNGIYHLFYQYNPKGAVWGNIVWAHSVSKDLINWEALEPAIYPSKHFDINGCWSGSATVLPNNKPVIFYTGIDPDNYQVQNYAVPANLSDPYLHEWIKLDDNPIVVADETMNKTAFRDPTTAWKVGGHWRMLVASRRKHRGMAYLYRSRDFKKWVKAKHPLHSVANTGMFECADFFPVSLYGDNGLDTSSVGPNVKHVLKVSLDLTRFEYYTIGSYIPEPRDKYLVDKNFVDGWEGLRFDYGNYYASKTFFDPSKNRRVLWGWSNESDTAQDDINKGWAGLQTIPRKLWLDPSGKQLLLWPIEEIETLRGQKVQLSNQKLKLGEPVEVKGITAAQADVDVTFTIPNLDKAEAFDPSWTNAQDLCGLKGSTVQGGVGPFGLLTLASENLEEYTPVFFRVFKGQDKHVFLLCSDASSSSLRESGLYKPSFAGFVDVDLAAEKKISLRSLIDHSVVESFGAGGKTCITSRVYPTLAVFDNAHLFVFNNGIETITADVEAWSMGKPCKMNN